MPRRILIIDDEEDAFELLSRLLRRVGATEAVEWCGDGERGLQRLRELAAEDALPALVILDLKMPILDGFSVLAALNSTPMLSAVPVVVVSSSSLPKDIARSVQLGALCYLEKYPDRETLARVYALATGRSSAAPAPVHENALQRIIGLVEDALALLHVGTAEQTAADRELLASLNGIRGRAIDGLLGRLQWSDRPGFSILDS